MGRGRQKAKQQKIARKLKYLTTDTNYAELAKELSSQEGGDTPSLHDGNAPEVSRAEPSQVAQAVTSSTVEHTVENTVESANEADEAVHNDVNGDPVDDDLDDYAKWAAEAAAKATSGELPVVKHAPSEHKPIPMPVPGILKTKRGHAASAA